jgi:hypothetical protein
MINEAYLRWLGGFFDGEGSVSISHSPNGQKNGNRTFRLMVTLSQKDTFPLIEVKRLFGGRLAINNSGCSQITLQSRQAARFLEAIAPYVRIKRRVVDLGLVYRDFVDGNEFKHWEGRALANVVADCLRREVMRINKES